MLPPNAAVLSRRSNALLVNQDKSNRQVDASSRFQDSLPISSDHLLKQLDEWKISYKCYNHAPLSTVKESKHIQNQFLNSREGGGHIKNLYLRDHKKNNILVVAEQDHIIDLKKLKETLGTGRLSPLLFLPFLLCLLFGILSPISHYDFIRYLFWFWCAMKHNHFGFRIESISVTS